jgi:hypothetical protein
VLLYGEVVKRCSNICVKQGQIQVLWGHEAYTIFGALFKKRKKIQNYEYKFEESEYLFIKRKEFTASYK